MDTWPSNRSALPGARRASPPARRLVAATGLLVLLVLGPGARLARGQDEHPLEQNSCVVCHASLADDAPELAAPVAAMGHDIHWNVGHVCANCHGGNPLSAPDDQDAAMDPAHGFVGKPEPGQIPGFCGRCHSDYNVIRQYNPHLNTDQVTQYWTSKHGELLRQGDKKVATCISCHGVHGIRSASDPLSSVYVINIPTTCGRCHDDAQYMAGYHVKTGILTEYRKSVHGHALFDQGDLSAPTCNDCHGNHGPLPPKATSIAHVCGVCHLQNAELFAASPHEKAFADMGLGQCTECHGVHEILAPQDSWLGVGGQSVCVNCHAEGDAGYMVAEYLGAQVGHLKQRYDQVAQLIGQAERAGVEVSEAHFQLNELKTSLVKARTQIHACADSAVTEVTSPAEAQADSIESICRAALAEAGVRRKGLAVAAAFVLLVSGLLYLVIRRLERRQIASR
jgi:predicted CXXCH cytochrome family protein